MSALTHYLTGPGTVACDMPWSVVSTVTESRALVTCNDCRQVILATPAPTTDVRPSVRVKLRQIRQMLGDYDRGVIAEADALNIIRDIIEKGEPGDG